MTHVAAFVIAAADSVVTGADIGLGGASAVPKVQTLAMSAVADLTVEAAHSTAENPPLGAGGAAPLRADLLARAAGIAAQHPLHPVRGLRPALVAGPLAVGGLANALAAFPLRELLAELDAVLVAALTLLLGRDFAGQGCRRDEALPTAELHCDGDAIALVGSVPIGCARELCGWQTRGCY